MGVRGNRNNPSAKPVYTEKSIQKILRAHFMSPNSMKYRIENLSVYSWESDSLSVTKSGYVYECEIKISRSDFFNDKKKERKHQILEGTYQTTKWENKYPSRPNYFYYVVPDGLIQPDEIPSYAGLIYITTEWPYVKIVLSAPKINNDKIDEDELNLKEKFYYNYINWKEKAESGYEDTIERLREQIKESRYDDDGLHHKYNLSEANEKVASMEKMLRIEEDLRRHYESMYFDENELRYDMEQFLLEKGVPIAEIRERKLKFRNKHRQDDT